MARVCALSYRSSVACTNFVGAVARAIVPVWKEGLYRFIRFLIDLTLTYVVLVIRKCKPKQSSASLVRDSGDLGELVELVQSWLAEVDVSGS